MSILDKDYDVRERDLVQPIDHIEVKGERLEIYDISKAKCSVDFRQFANIASVGADEVANDLRIHFSNGGSIKCSVF